MKKIRAPETMTVTEQAALLRATTDAPWDYLLYSRALGTGLRLRELPGLNVDEPRRRRPSYAHAADDELVEGGLDLPC